MRTTQAHVRGIYATALNFLDDDQTPAESRHLHRALDTAISRRHPEADRRDRRRLRHMALEGLEGWTDASTRAELALQLRQAARCGLDLAELVGQPYAVVAGRIWWHGAYSAKRLREEKPAPRGLSYDGRPWAHLRTDDEEARNPVVLHVDFAA